MRQMTFAKWSRRLGLLAGLLGACLAAASAAHAAPPPFDVDQATRAYLDTLQGAARARSDAYMEGGYWLPLWGALISILIDIALLRFGLSARFRNFAERVARKQWRVPGVYMLPYILVGALATLPWTIYVGFVRERRYGLMSLSFTDWLGEQLIGLVLSLLAGALLASLIFAVIRAAPRRWWLWASGVTVAFLAFIVVLAPVFVAPLFNTYAEMPSGPLRDRIVAMARSQNVPAEHIYVFDQSRQTKRISANVSGLGPTIRVSLNDNLLKRTTPPEVVAVMGHELGHYVLGHGWRLILELGLLVVAAFWLVSRAVPRLLARHGEAWGVRDVADPAAIPLFGILFAILGLLGQPLVNSIIRHSEIEADRFGLDVAREPDAFAKVAIRLAEYRKLEPGPIEEALFYDHPSGANRIRRAMKWKADHLAEVVGRTQEAPDRP